MRLWTLHPQYLDRQGLVAVWREALLAQKVLAGKTRGYRDHPQLQRFRAAPDPGAAIAAYLRGILEEAERRGYNFERSLILSAPPAPLMRDTYGQIRFEWLHLREKLRERDPAQLARYARVETPRPHPLFRSVPGSIAGWERGAPLTRASTTAR